MYRIKIDRSRCIGCLTCVTACVVSHQDQSGDARNRVTIDSGTKPAPIYKRLLEQIRDSGIFDEKEIAAEMKRRLLKND